MDPFAVEAYALAQLKKLMTLHRTKKTTLGEVLSDRTGEEPQKKFLRAQRFLNGQGSLKIEKMVRLAHYFNQPITYFFPAELVNPYALQASSETQNKKTSNKSLADIEANLRHLGFDEDFIKSQIRQLKALQSYDG